MPAGIKTHTGIKRHSLCCRMPAVRTGDLGLDLNHLARSGHVVAPQEPRYPCIDLARVSSRGGLAVRAVELPVPLASSNSIWMLPYRSRDTACHGQV